MSSASSSKNQIVPMVWSLIALTLATFTLVMVMTGNAMFQFTEQHEQMDKQHRQLIQASEQIKFQVDQIRNEILQILNNQDSQDLIAKEPQTEKLQEFITVIKHTANSNNLDQLIQDFTRSLQPVHKVWMAAQDWRWRQTDFELTIRYKNALHKMRKTLSHTRSAVDSYEGQLRIKKAIEIRKYYRSGQQQKPLLAQQIIETNTKAADSIVRKFKIDLAELARLTEILNGEQQQHRLASIKDNEFKSTFNRLSHNAAVIPENLSAQLHFSLKNIEALLVAVFGNGYLIDNIHQTIKPGEGGLYQQRYKTLQLRKEQQAINYQLDTVLKPLYINSDKLVDEASKYSAMLMQ
ncbi:MAG: hypothetical protein KAQ67_07440, partial [Gammaproteobacteria bacterium]|nr:hypothetical protein [Gammaproteobacteria bacterium]